MCISADESKRTKQMLFENLLANQTITTNRNENKPMPTNTTILSKVPDFIWATVNVGIFRTMDDIEYALSQLPIIRSWDKSLPFMSQSFKTLDLVTIRPCLFEGEKKRMSRLEICQLGVSLGLQECPQEVGPQLLIQGKAPGGYEEVNIASTEPLGSRKDVYLVVGNRGTAGLGCYVEDEKGFDTHTLWAFVKPRKQERQ